MGGLGVVKVKAFTDTEITKLIVLALISFN